MINEEHKAGSGEWHIRGLRLSSSISPLRHSRFYKHQMVEIMTESAIIEMHKVEESLQTLASSADMAVAK